MRVALLVSSIAISGCDGAFRVKGELVTQSGAPASCQLHLLNASGLGRIQTRDVKGPFLTTFTVAPWDGEYDLRLSCSGVPDRARRINYGSEVNYEEPVDLGRVVL